jgi:coenzyme F420-reducing hydrogenase gamma subunit
MNTPSSTKLKLAVFKFASCDGCQLSLLDCEDELLTVASLVEIAHFLEASSTIIDGPYDVTLVEGSITTPHDRQRIREIRKQSKVLITIGACATSGGIQALRNWGDYQEFLRAVYARPEYISSLATSTAIGEHVKVEYELRGCPINRHQLVEVIRTLAAGRRPRLASHSVCMECKVRGTVCIAVAQGVPCLGPITHTGCGAICPAYDRGCYTCFGPAYQANADSLISHYQSQGISSEQLTPLLRNYNALASTFREVSSRLDGRIALPLAGS